MWAVLEWPVVIDFNISGLASTKQKMSYSSADHRLQTELHLVFPAEQRVLTRIHVNIKYFVKNRLTVE